MPYLALSNISSSRIGLAYFKLTNYNLYSGNISNKGVSSILVGKKGKLFRALGGGF